MQTTISFYFATTFKHNTLLKPWKLSKLTSFDFDDVNFLQHSKKKNFFQRNWINKQFCLKIIYDILVIELLWDKFIND